MDVIVVLDREERGTVWDVIQITSTNTEKMIEQEVYGTIGDDAICVNMPIISLKDFIDARKEEDEDEEDEEEET